MLFFFACHAQVALLDTADPESVEAPEATPTFEATPSGSLPALQSPLDGESVSEGPVDFKILSESPVAISVFLLEDLGAPIMVIDELTPQDGSVTWMWDDADPWVTYAWQAENTAGTSVIWQFNKRGPNEAPEVPELMSPSDNETVMASELSFAVRGGDDPDGDPILYTIEVLEEGHPPVISPLLSEDELPWEPDLDLDIKTSLCWTAWAVDDKEDHGFSAEPKCFELVPD